MAFSFARCDRASSGMQVVRPACAGLGIAETALPQEAGSATRIHLYSREGSGRGLTMCG
jgi:hypothetical protein